MNQIKINIPISFVEQNSIFIFENNEVELTFNLEEGKHIYQSKQIKFGSYHWLDLFFLLEIPYSYNTEAKEFIFADKNYKQEDLIKFHIFSGDNNLISSVFTYNEHITNVSPLFSLEHDSFLRLKIDEIIDKISPVIISTLLEAGVRNVFKPSFAPKVTKENFDKFKGILENDLVNTIENIILLQKRLNSIYLGKDNFYREQIFANVINSSGDPSVNSKSWIQLWKESTGNYAPTCTSLYSWGDPKDATKYYSNFQCKSNYIYGGHVLLWESKARDVPHSTKAKPQIVWILPICVTHNNNDNVFMVAVQNLNINNYVEAVRLDYWPI